MVVRTTLALALLACVAEGFSPTVAAGVRSLAPARPLQQLHVQPRTAPIRLAEPPEKKKSFLPFFLDVRARRADTPTGSVIFTDALSWPSLACQIGTKGGIVFYTVVGIGAPFFAYNYMLETLGYDVVFAGNVILVGYVGLATVLWTASYVFRVANKDMTYAQQLRDYENAVIQKRFEELNEDEVDALMGEIYPGKPGGPPA